MYYDYEDKRYHEGEPPEKNAFPQNDRPDTDPYGSYGRDWSVPAYRSADDQQTSYSPGYNNSGTGYNNRYQSRNWSEPAETKKKSHDGAKRFLRALCLVLVCALVSATVGYGVADYRMKSTPVKTTENRVVIGSSTASAGKTAEKNETKALTVTGDEMSGNDIYDLACSQVVGIQVAGTGSTVNIFGQRTMTPAVSGSGFVISSDGYIATNCHVIEYAVIYGEQYGYQVTVITEDGTSYPAEIVGYDKDNDIAVLKIEATGLNAVAFGSSDNVLVGDKVYTVGNPLGELEYTMTSGIVSALDREITTEESIAVNMFQIDAAVNSGNSGGPVYNAKGEVIGIVTAKSSATGVDGIGFAIPIDDAVKIFSDLIEHGYVLGKAYMGVTLDTLSGTYLRYYNLPEGAYVMTVAEGSAAERAGLKVGDIITGIDGKTITSRDAVKAALRDYSVGDSAVITVYRSGQYEDVTIVFDEQPHTDNTSAAPAVQAPGN